MSKAVEKGAFSKKAQENRDVYYEPYRRAAIEQWKQSMERLNLAQLIERAKEIEKTLTH